MLPRIETLVVTITPGEFEGITPYRLDSQQHILPGIGARVSSGLIAL